MIEVWVDGACSGNPGPGGWAAIVVEGGKKRELSGAARDTTNNRMELMAAIKGMSSVRKPSAITVFTDSAYVADPFEKDWIWKWLRRGWKTSTGPVKNRDLWEQMLTLYEFHRVKFTRVKGHSGVYLNERCDSLATAAIRKEIRNDDLLEEGDEILDDLELGAIRLALW